MHTLFYECVYIETPVFISICSVSQSHRSSRNGYDISDIFWCVSHFVSPSSLTGHSCSLCQCVDREACLSVSFCVACVVKWVCIANCCGTYVWLYVNSIEVPQKANLIIFCSRTEGTYFTWYWGSQKMNDFKHWNCMVVY